MVRAALYLRVSTQEQAQHGLSLGDQRTALESYAVAHNMTIVGIYEDAGISARKSYKKRPALLRLLNDCQTGQIDTILFVKLDRWFRNVGSYYEVQTILDKYNVTWQAIKEDYETVSASGRLKVNIMLSVAQDEADRTSERIKFVNEGKRARKEALTGQPPFGYKIVDSKFIIDPELEPIVRSVFQTYMDTNSIKDTQNYILENYDRWLQYWVIDKILRSDAYIGTYFGTQDMCPPYITLEQHEELLRIRKRIVRKSPTNRIYIFSGLITCGECGGRVGAKCQTNHNNFVCYACSRRSNRKSNCDNVTTLSQRKIEEYMVGTLDDKLKKYKLQYQGAKPVNNSSKIKALQTKMGRLKDLYINGVIDMEELKAERAKFESKIKELEQSNKKAPDFSKISKMLTYNWQQLYFDSSTEAKANFWRILVKDIKVFKDRHIEYELNI